MNERIEITVSPKGETTVETKGFAGGKCLQAGRFIEAALGKRTDEQLTSEYYLAQPVQEQNEQRA